MALRVGTTTHQLLGCSKEFSGLRLGLVLKKDKGVWAFLNEVGDG